MEFKEVKYCILYQVDAIHWDNKYYYTLEEAESALKTFQDSGISAQLSELFPYSTTENDSNV